MPSQTATTPPLTVSLLALLWVSLGRWWCTGGVSEPSWPGCDNGKVSLDIDLPTDASHWDCPTSLLPQSQRLYSVDTVYDPEPASFICLDKPITYNHTIPNSGAFRPVSADSGEYLYCPPQRWLNNLHHGATVLLYHPCTPLQERLLLSVLAQSCIKEYIITPHKNLEKNMPIALVSWGRTLEVSTVDSSEICDWLETTSSTENNAAELRHKRKYNLLLTRSTEQNIHENSSVDVSERVKGSLKRCCEQAISFQLNERRKTHSSLKPGSIEQNKEKSRERRAATTGNLQTTQNESNNDNSTTNHPNIMSNKTRTNINMPQNSTGALKTGTHSPPDNRNLLDQNSTKHTLSQSIIPNQNPGPIRTPKKSDISKTITNTISLVQSGNVLLQTETLKPKDKDKFTPSTEVLAPRAKYESGHSSKHRGRGSAKSVTGKDLGQVNKAVNNLKDNEVIDVEEREAKQKRGDEQHKSESHGLNSSAKSQSGPVSYVPNTEDCECKSDQLCDCSKASVDKSQAAVVNSGPPVTPRSDEAVWAAAALGFLLVLLTLSILHTRLYRHWRIAPSLYWHDPRQDYDSVADVIRRRLRLAKRRRKRGRRQEYVLLPSSSSSEEYP